MIDWVYFKFINDNRADNKSIEQEDALMSAFTIFSLKYPTLIQGVKDIDADKKNLKSLYNCEISCNLFQAALKIAETRTYFWKKIRHLFDSFLFESMNCRYIMQK